MVSITLILYHDAVGSIHEIRKINERNKNWEGRNKMSLLMSATENPKESINDWT